MNIDKVVETLESFENPAQLYLEGSDEIACTKENHHEDTVALIGADYPSGDINEISTPIQIIDCRAGVVIFLQDDSQISVSKKQLAAIAQFAKAQGVI